MGGPYAASITPSTTMLACGSVGTTAAKAGSAGRAITGYAAGLTSKLSSTTRTQP